MSRPGPVARWTGRRKSVDRWERSTYIYRKYDHAIANTNGWRAQRHIRRIGVDETHFYPGQGGPERATTMTMRPVQHIAPPLRLFSGPDCLRQLGRELERLGSRRAVIFCGTSLARAGALLDLIRAATGERCAGVFSGVRAHSPLPAVEAGAGELRRLAGGRGGCRRRRLGDRDRARRQHPARRERRCEIPRHHAGRTRRVAKPAAGRRRNCRNWSFPPPQRRRW